MIKFVGYLILFISFQANALVPVEGILMGEARSDIQNDPLSAIFSDIYDKTRMGENKKLKLYQSMYESGQGLHESCSVLGAPSYATPWQEKQARRMVAATLQYIGLDSSIKAVGAYAKKLEMGDDEWGRLKGNLVKNYCSKNITIFSLKNIEKSLEHYFRNPEADIIPDIQSSPFAPAFAQSFVRKDEATSKEFDLVIKNFRAFCSWGSEVEDYRMLTPYLNNRFIMAFVIKNMMGIQDQIESKQFKVVTVSSPATVQVGCADLICRKESSDDFKRMFPFSVGSTGLGTDLSKLYCHHFRYQDAPQKTIPQVAEWIKARELEDPIFETSQLIALMTGVPDFMNGADTYRDIPLLARSSIDERWTKWANKVLGTFSHDLYYEESLKVKVEQQNDMAYLSSEGFMVNLSVTLGEIDRLLVDNDKLDLVFHLKLSKNFMRSLRSRSFVLDNAVDEEGRKLLHEEISHYINLQLKEKEKLFTQKMWNDEFSKLVTDELLRQVRIYRGPLFNSYQDEILTVPIKFSYGLFALSYLRYRADVAAGRLKINL